jgi:hypothetical protein
MLEQDYDGAISAAQGALVEVRMIYTTILDERDRQNALREQAEALQKGISAAERAG